MTSPIYVAIDTPDMDRARAIAAAVKRQAGGLKLGLEFFCHNGRHGVMELAELGLPIFLDLKLHDIPNTVAKSIQALAPITPAVQVTAQDSLGNVATGFAGTVTVAIATNPGGGTLSGTAAVAATSTLVAPER